MNTRRGFLEGAMGWTAAAVVAGRVGGALPARASAERKGGAIKMRVGVGHGMIKEGATIMAQMRAAKEAGFDGVEFQGPMEDGQIAQILEARSATGVEACGLVGGKAGRMCGSLDAGERATGVEEFAKALRQAKQLGATTVLMYSGKCEQDKPYDKVFNTLIDSVGKLLPVAKETGVAIALENVWNDMFLSPLDVIAFVDHFKSPLVGWYFDIGNVCRYGWPEHWIRALGPRILKLHVKEFSRKKHMAEGPWAGFKIELGEGDIDWKAVNAAIADVGYAGGWVTAEVPGGNLERLKAISAWTKKVMAV